MHQDIPRHIVWTNKLCVYQTESSDEKANYFKIGPKRGMYYLSEETVAF